MDESGKTADYLIVGSIWFLHGYETHRISQEIKKWREEFSYEREFHFKKIRSYNLPFYKKIADLLAENSNAISFKVISVERAGTGHVQQALLRLYYHLLLRGVEHEDRTERAPLPRNLQVWKDAEEPGSDKLFLAELRDRLEQVANTTFGEELHIDNLEAVRSEHLDLIQLADLFTSSVNRVLNVTGSRTGPKDEFADYFLDILGMPDGYRSEESLEDMTVHLSL